MKIKLLTAAILSALSAQSFAITKNIDFYSGSYSGSNRYTVSGTVSDLADKSFSGNSLLVDGINQSAYITLNGHTPYLLTYNEQEINLYDLFNKNKGKQITIANVTYTVVGHTGEFLVLSTADSDSYTFKKIDSNIQIPKDWVMNGQKGLRATFDEVIKPTDKLYYSQLESGLGYKNEYQAIIKDDKKIEFVHYVNINNSTGKSYENVLLTFFLSEANIQDRIRPVMYKSMARAETMMASDMNQDSGKPDFQIGSISGLKTISIDEPVNINPNMNKIKYNDKNYDYENYVTLAFDNSYAIYIQKEKNIAEYEKEYKEITDTVRESLLRNKEIFTDMIRIKTDKVDILPSGDLEVYDKQNGAERLIISTNTQHTENSDLEVIKSKNRDLKIKDISFSPIITPVAVKIIGDNGRFEIKIESITIKNESKNDYNIELKGIKHLIKGNDTVKIDLPE